jgi:hypothetical protein
MSSRCTLIKFEVSQCRGHFLLCTNILLFYYNGFKNRDLATEPVVKTIPVVWSYYRTRNYSFVFFIAISCFIFKVATMREISQTSCLP